MDIGGFTDGFAESTLNSLAARAAKFGVNEVIVEKNYGGGMFSSLFKPVLQKVCKAKLDPEEEVWSVGQKEVRILDTLEPLIQAHRLTIDRRVIEKDLLQQRDQQKYSFIYQLTRLTRDRDCLAHEDRVEALSGACAFFVKKLSYDLDVVVKRHKAKLVDEELRKFKRNAYHPTRPHVNKLPHIRGGRR